MITAGSVANEISEFLEQYRQTIEQAVFQSDIPLIGADFTSNAQHVFAHIDALAFEVDRVLGELDAAAGIAEIVAALDGLELPDAAGPVISAFDVGGNLSLEIELARALNFDPVSVDQDLGLAPGGVTFDGDIDLDGVTFETNLALTFDAANNAAISIGTPVSGEEEFRLSIEGDLGIGGEASLGFIGFAIDEQEDGADPNVTFDFAIDLDATEPSEVNISGGLNLGITTTTDTAVLPTVGANLVAGYSIIGSVPDVSGGTIDAAVDLGFEDITLDPGALVDLFDGIFGQVSDILDTFPLGVAIDILLQPIPVVDDIAPGLDTIGNGDGVTIADLVAAFPGTDDNLEFISAVVDVLKIADAVAQLGSLDGPIELGDISLIDFQGSLDFNAPTIPNLFDDLGGFGDAITAATDGGDGFSPYLSLPVFEDPFTVVGGLLLNGFGAEPVTLIELDFPELTFNSEAEISFPVGPFKLFIEGSFGGRTDFTVGYDTFGFASGGADFLQGFYIQPTDPNDAFAQLSLGLRAGGGVGIVVGSVVAAGGVTGEIDFHLAAGDGTRTRLSDLAAFPCIFDEINGRITASVDVEVSFGIAPLKITERIVIGEVELANFGFDPVCAGPHGGAPQVFDAGLAVEIDPGILDLVVGNLALTTPRDLNGIDINPDTGLPFINESFLVTRAPVEDGEQEDQNAVAVNAFGVYEVFTGPSPFTRIDGNGGQGNDNLGLEADLDIAARFRGGAGDDILTGGVAGDTLYGGEGDDLLTGNAGDDALYGGLGDDVLAGGLGADSLFGGGIVGNAGLDEVDYSLSDEGVTLTRVVGSLGSFTGSGGMAEGDFLDGIEYIRGSAFDDTLLGTFGGSNVLQGNGGSDSIEGGDQDDLLVGGAGADSIDGLGGQDITSYGFSPAGVWIHRGLNAFLGGDAQGDEITDVEIFQLSTYDDFYFADASEEEEIDGEGGDDFIQLVGGNDTGDGGGGDDTILASGQGGDVLGGGGTLFDGANAEFSDTGRDLLSYEAVTAGVIASLLDGIGVTSGPLPDTIRPLFTIGEDGARTAVAGRSSFEDLTGSDFGDVLAGDDAGNVIRGGAGNDAIDGNSGADTLIGGEGADSILGGDGLDWLDLSESDAGVTVDLNTGIGTGGHADGDEYDEIENVIGTDLDDTLIGDGAANILDPGAPGNGTVTEVIDGNGGTDTLRLDYNDLGSDLRFEFTGGLFSDSAEVFRGASTIPVLDLQSIEQLIVTTGNGDDEVNGFDLNAPLDNLLDGDDVVTTGAGNDTIAVGAGRDFLFAGAGDDVVTRSAGPGEIFVIEGGTGTDTLNADFSYETVDIDLVSTELDGEDVSQRLNLSDGAVITGFEVYQFIATGAGDDHLVQLGEIDNIFATGQGADLIELDFGTNIVSGGESDTDGATDIDTLVLDYRSAAAGSFIESGYNDDIVPQGFVTLFSAPITEAGATFYQGIERIDFTGTSSGDTLVGITANEADVTAGDTLTGLGGSDLIYGGGQEDVIFGGQGLDVLFGDDDADQLFGGRGGDSLFGGGGNDTLTAGGVQFADGVDEYTGGDGADRFVLGDRNGSHYGNPLGFPPIADEAIIHDFNAAEGDVIVLAGSASDYTATPSAAGTIIRDSDGDDIVLIENVLVPLSNPAFEFVPLSQAVAAPSAAFAEGSAPAALASLTDDGDFTVNEVQEISTLSELLSPAFDKLDTSGPGLPAVSNLTFTFEGDDQALGSFQNAPFDIPDGIVISTGRVEELPGQNLEDGADSPNPTPASLADLEFVEIGTTAGGSAVFRAEITDLSQGLGSITLTDSNSFEGAGGRFAGFDLDGVILSRDLLASVDAATDINDPSTLTALDVFDFSPLGTLFNPGDQTVRFDPTTGTTIPAEANLEGTINGFVDEGFARLGLIDFDGNAANGGAFSMGDGGSVTFSLTEIVDTNSPLFLYVAEAFANDEGLGGNVTVASQQVTSIGDLTTDLGQPGEDGDTSTLTVEFDYTPRLASLGDLSLSELFKIVLVSEELPENGGSLAEDIVSVKVNGLSAALLSDGQPATLGNLALSPVGPFHPDLTLNLDTDGPLRDVLRADSYTETLRIAGPILGTFGGPPTRNVIEFEVADSGNGLLDTAMFIAPIVVETITGSVQDDTLTGSDNDETFIPLGGPEGDLMTGYGGNDDYRVDVNDGGVYVIQEHANRGFDRLVLDGGLDPANLTFFRGNNDRSEEGEDPRFDLFVFYQGFDLENAILIEGQYGANGEPVPALEQIVISDPGSRTPLQVIDLTQGLTFTGTPVDDIGPLAITGTSGDDTLIGLEGADELDGLGGSDTYIFSLQGMNGDLITETFSPEIDRIHLSGGLTADDVSFRRTGVDHSELSIFVSGPDSTSSVRIAAHYSGEFVLGLVEELMFDDGTVVDLTGPLQFTGIDNIGAPVETLPGTALDDVILGNAGRDSMSGGAGDDTLNGGMANDILDGDAGDDMLIGGRGADTAEGGIGNDTISLGRGVDEGYGGTGNDTLDGGAGGDTLDGGAGSDTADYSASGEAVVVASDGAFAIGGDAEGDTLTNIENLLGSAFADFLRGDGQANVLTGGAGADYIQGRGGDDTLNGGENDDLLEPGAGADTVDGGSGQDLLSALDAAGPVTIDLGNVALSSAGYADKTLISIEGVLGVAGFGNTLVGGGGEDLLIGGDVADSIAGAGGADILLGLGGADTISGGAGDDLILGLEGDDVLTGDAGRDLFLFEPGDGADVVTDFELPVGGAAFEDRLFFSGLGIMFADLDIAEVGGDVVIGYGTNPAAFDGSVTVEGVTLADLVPGGAQPDWILVF